MSEKRRICYSFLILSRIRISWTEEKRRKEIRVFVTKPSYLEALDLKKCRKIGENIKRIESAHYSLQKRYTLESLLNNLVKYMCCSISWTPTKIFCSEKVSLKLSEGSCGQFWSEQKVSPPPPSPTQAHKTLFMSCLCVGRAGAQIRTPWNYLLKMFLLYLQIKRIPRLIYMYSIQNCCICKYS